MNKATPKKKSKFLKTVLIASMLLCCQSLVQAQSTEQSQLSKNSVYLDATLAVFTQVSINYERQICSSEKISWFGRVGVGETAQLSGDKGSGALAAITMLTGKKNGHFEVNVGSFLGGKSNNAFAHPVLNIGYRYQKPEGGFIFRTNAGIIGIGIGLGYAF